MPQRDTVDFVAAFTMGAVAGAAAALLLRPEPSTRTERVLKDLAPYRKKVRKSAGRARQGFGEGAAAAAAAGGALRDAGRELIRDFRSEMQDIVASARNELARAVRDQVDEAQRSLAKSVRRVKT